MFPIRQFFGCIIALVATGPTLWAEARLDTDIEFFEKQVRPLLVERCHGCHSAKAGATKGGLSLDSNASILKGGDGGVVVVPGEPERSRLAQAVEYSNPDLQMPPKGKLPEVEVQTLIAWIAKGALWPETEVSPTTAIQEGFDLESRRRRHWAWRPLQAPALPSVRDESWGQNPVDRFILASLEHHELSPAPSADRRTLSRRLSFDLTGLPPKPETAGGSIEIHSEPEYERTVDSLLASPHFGERWARHWLDLVRYAETLGHEFDYANPNAWRYRDYVIRALNDDVPYDQFVREHVAGDMLPKPRFHPTEGFNESVIGTAFFWLGQREHSPVDVRQHQAEVIDNQIDVLTKTFLGLTVACARCHDHKFDAIPTQDYYSLYGMLSSSRYTQAAIDPGTPLHATVGRLTKLRDQLRQRVGFIWLRQAEGVADLLLATNRLGEQASFDREWSSLVQAQAETDLLPVPAGPEYRVYADFTSGDLDLRSWRFEELAFGTNPVVTGSLIMGGAKEPVCQLLEEPALHSGGLSQRLQGVVRSPTFVMTNRYIHILAAGREARINVPVDNFTMIRDPIYGGLKQVVSSDEFHWLRIDAGMWKGHRAYLEFSDLSVADLADDAHRGGFAPTGYLAVRRIVFSEIEQPPALAREHRGTSLASGTAASRTELAIRCQSVVTDAAKAWLAEAPMRPAQARLLNWFSRQGLLDAAADPEVQNLLRQYRQTEETIPDPTRVPAMTEGTGLDEPVFVRGNHRLPGPLAPRRFLQAIAGPTQPSISSGSGRMELADRMLDPNNPFVARVIVNRVWLHLFGRGLVATPDDFGVLGQAPTHPELLDWLAEWFRTEGGWSIKRLVRLLVTSKTYQMSSRPDNPVAERSDPENQLWHRMPLRRLEGESIRDAMLAVSGRLDPSLFGPPVPIHLTEFMDGRGRPSVSGPLDGAGRRSLYLEVRRNFVSPMIRTFDMPVPFTTIGRRTVSNVPAQSLILMNDPFVLGEAERWAKRILAFPDLNEAERIRRMYTSAFHREALEAEVRQALGFLRVQTEAYKESGADDQCRQRVWADLAHVLFNVKEFVFLN